MKATPLAPNSPPTHRLNLSRISGLMLLAGIAWCIGSLGGDAMTGQPGLAADDAVAAWFHAQRTPGLMAVMQLATGLGSAAWVTGITLVAALGLAWSRRWHELLAIALAVPGGMALNVFLKTFFHRPRPGADAWSQVFSGYGFPSGHTMAATLLYGALAVLACGASDTVRAWMSAIVGAWALVGLVGWSRLQLGAHFLSDVIGAIVLGLAWLGLSFTAAGALHHLVSARIHR